MLLSNSLAINTELDLSGLRRSIQFGFEQMMLQLPNEICTTQEFQSLLQLARIKPIAYRAPKSLTLGDTEFSLSEWLEWFHIIHATTSSPTFLIVHGTKVALGTIFEYLDARPTDFYALQDYKTEYVQRIIDQLTELKKHADQHQIELLLENAPMGDEGYFEPGHSELYPALRTPNHLLKIVEKTGVKLCFDTANARITSHLLTYMHRSRSMFAGATEKEILYASPNWLEFYEKIQPHVAFIQLSYAMSWGDTRETTHISFPTSSYGELLTFAETVNPETPISIAIPQSEPHLRNMMDALHALKSG
ncbi:hypothetical protein J2Z48_000431 [Croceifilum oryzae]|uniref:Xylose isomerase-like TIM barrel domain-containing protein n=1 Tax=Croceifilum oryzae TaxID=1553429 RepID=A0AAJ1TGT2_9BACL|nr:hypothetical protein [Croceifilum oryzae]MDQ0416267.1 hypothetical protein [Croceifilum oryzae]